MTNIKFRELEARIKKFENEQGEIRMEVNKKIIEMIRDVCMFREMSQVMLLSYTGKITELEFRIEKLEKLHWKDYRA